MTLPDRCPCGLRPACPYGQQRGEPLMCPVWERHVRPSLVERIVALFMGRW
jgi:hypothetical protein